MLFLFAHHKIRMANYVIIMFSKGNTGAQIK
jgi:hypothetical protein